MENQDLQEAYYFTREYPVQRPNLRKRNITMCIWTLCLVILCFSVIGNRHMLDTEWLPNYYTVYDILPMLLPLSDNQTITP